MIFQYKISALRCAQFLCSLMLFFAVFAHAKVNLEIKGISGQLYDNVELRLSNIKFDNLDDTPSFRTYITNEIKKGLRALGYYSPTIKFSYEKKRRREKLTVTIDKGEPIITRQIKVNIHSNGHKLKSFNELIKSYDENIGQVLNHSNYEQLKSRLQALALQKGYFNAVMAKNELAISEARHSAFWWIDFNLGTRYQFGEITINNSQIDEEYIKNITPFKTGDYYSSEKISNLNRNLSSTNWFRTINIIPQFDKLVKKNGHIFVPITIDLKPKKKNSFDLGLGFSSDNGITSRVGWKKPWINDRGDSLESAIKYSSKEWSISMDYRIPVKKNALTDYYNIQGGFKHEERNDTDANSYNVGLIRNWYIANGWKVSSGGNVLLADFTQGSDNYKTFMVYPSLSLIRIKNDNSYFPMWADSQRYTIEASSAEFFSDVAMLRTQVQHTWIRSIGDSNRFILRGNFGYVDTADFSRIPPSFRFFAGGDRSIRGYSYQSISPKNSQGELTGGSKLITGSFEYDRHFVEQWWGALFIDSGEAIDGLTDTNFKTGVGTGIRWISPIGPIKFDVATPIDSITFKSIQIYIAFGSEL